MKRFLTLLAIVVALGLWATAAAADGLGNTIAKTLCLTQAYSMTLSKADSAQYDAAAEISGKWTTMEGLFVVIAKFSKRDDTASCERSACHAMGGSNCLERSWPIFKCGNELKMFNISSPK